MPPTLAKTPITVIMKSIEEMLRNEDQSRFTERLIRREWIADNFHLPSEFAISGGIVSQYLLDESIATFIDGWFISTIVTGLAFVEHEIAAKLYASGINKAARLSLQDILDRCAHRGSLVQAEIELIAQSAKLRNRLVHFKSPLNPNSIELRAMENDLQALDILERDGKAILRMVSIIVNDWERLFL